MITKVKGEAIKEGSIPYSALATEVKEKIDKLVNITYANLKSLRDNSQLIPGQQYRITDYITTTTQEGTQSAGHQFDIIVTADDEKTLNENARAIQHEGDTYFSNSNLAAWELKYSLDNDLTRFEWAQVIELSPVSKRKIIRVENDEEGYSFIYLRYPEGDENGEYAWVYDCGGVDCSIKEYISIGEEDFDSDKCINTTTENPSVGYSIDDYSSVIEVSSTAAEDGKGVIYYMKDEWNNECPYDFKNIMFRVTSGQSEYNYYTFHNPYSSYKDATIENGTYGNVIKPYTTGNQMSINKIRFGSGCYNNSFGNDCYNNTLGDSCNYNSFGNECYNNSFGYSCRHNIFGNYCHNNSFGNGYSNNILGNSCEYNSFGNYCEYNIFGNDCNNNSFGYSCKYNSFGNYCNNNTLGDSCNYNSFGNNCKYNIFGASKNTLKSYYHYITFDNGNSFINLNCTSTTSNKKYYQNVRIGLGVNNTTITDSNVGQTYETLYKPANSQTITI